MIQPNDNHAEPGQSGENQPQTAENSPAEPQPDTEKTSQQPVKSDSSSEPQGKPAPKPAAKESHEHKTHKEPPKQMLVRYGLMGHLGWFEHHEKHIPPTETHAVVKTDRGLELGRIVGNFNYRHGQFKCSCKEVSDYYGQGEQRCPVYSGGAFVRFGTHEDLNEARHLEISSKEEMKTCRKFIRELNLPMKLVDSEHLFGGERIVFYFTSDGRVDFRELVKRLAKEYQTRIELRQIGSRDEARILADFESCGQEVCCKRFLKILEPVNMKMAKLQKATLDPSKISGHCGRLKCCLRYEDQTYRDLKKNMPRRNSFVKTANGIGKVFDAQVLTQLVVVQYDNGDREAWPVEEISPASQEEVAQSLEQKNDKSSGRSPRPRGQEQKSRQRPKPEQNEQDFPEEDFPQDDTDSPENAQAQPDSSDPQDQGQQPQGESASGEAKDKPSENNRSQRNNRGRSNRSNQNGGEGGEKQNKSRRRRKNRRGRKRNSNKNDNAGNNNKDS